MIERRVDWIMGSGHHSRVYLFQTTNGALFQLPLAWHAQDGKWAMAPGYEFAEHPGVHRAVPQRCTACHMPNRRTQDVIEVWMTDHNIMRKPANGLLQPIPKEPPQVTEVMLKSPHAVGLVEGRMQKTIVVLNFHGYEARYVADALEEQLDAAPAPFVEPWFALAQARLVENDALAALIAVRKALAIDPDNPKARSILGAAYARGNALGKARETLESLLTDVPGSANDQYNLAIVHVRAGRTQAAYDAAQAALAQRDTHWKAQRMIAEIGVSRGNRAAAIDAYLATLAMEPQADHARAPLAELLRAAGREVEAARHADD